MDYLDLDTLNPGIRKTVELLRDHGFNTCDSGDGSTHTFECDREHGYVSILLPEGADLRAEGRRVVEALQAAGVCFRFLDDGWHPHVEATYLALDNVSILDINFIDDSELGPC